MAMTEPVNESSALFAQLLCPTSGATGKFWTTNNGHLYQRPFN